MRRRTVQPNSRSFVSVLRSPVTPFDRSKRRTRTVRKSATFLATESVNLSAFKRGETKVQIFGKEKCKTLRNTKMKFWQRKGAKFITNFSVWQGKVQNSSPISALLRWRHFRLSLSLSLSLLSLSPLSSPSAPHAQYRKRFRTSYNTLPVHVHT